MGIHVLKVAVGRESVVADALRSLAKGRNFDIKAIFYTQEIKGYIFVEGDRDQIIEAIKEIPPVRGYLQTISIEEIKKYFSYKEARIDIEENDIVEVIGGPFKGERGKVVRIDKIKREVVIELIEATVALPLTLSLEMVRVIEKAKKEG